MGRIKDWYLTFCEIEGLDPRKESSLAKAQAELDRREKEWQALTPEQRAQKLALRGLTITQSPVIMSAGGNNNDPTNSTAED
jgi:hypothetical protein